MFLLNVYKFGKPVSSNLLLLFSIMSVNAFFLAGWDLQEDVDSFMKQPGNETADAVLRRLDEQYQKYKYMELNLSQKKLR